MSQVRDNAINFLGVETNPDVIDIFTQDKQVKVTNKHGKTFMRNIKEPTKYADEISAEKWANLKKYDVRNRIPNEKEILRMSDKELANEINRVADIIGDELNADKEDRFYMAKENFKEQPIEIIGEALRDITDNKKEYADWRDAILSRLIDGKPTRDAMTVDKDKVVQVHGKNGKVFNRTIHNAREEKETQKTSKSMEDIAKEFATNKEILWKEIQNINDNAEIMSDNYGIYVTANGGDVDWVIQPTFHSKYNVYNEKTMETETLTKNEIISKIISIKNNIAKEDPETAYLIGKITENEAYQILGQKRLNELNDMIRKSETGR